MLCENKTWLATDSNNQALLHSATNMRLTASVLAGGGWALEKWTVSRRKRCKVEYQDRDRGGDMDRRTH